MSPVAVENVNAVFVFIGTRPHSDWLPPSVLRNAKGFVLTGRDADVAEALPKSGRKLAAHASGDQPARRIRRGRFARRRNEPGGFRRR